MYEKEADEIIGLAFSTYNSPQRTRLVADYITELIGALASGCTGLTTDPDGPTVAGADPVASGAAVLAGASDAEVDGFLGAVREDHPDERPEDYWREARGAVPRKPHFHRTEQDPEPIISHRTPAQWEDVARKYWDFPPAAPGGPTALCRACAASGVGVCDDYPNCPAGRRHEAQDPQ